jgi:hypothetical protein
VALEITLEAGTFDLWTSSFPDYGFTPGLYRIILARGSEAAAFLRAIIVTSVETVRVTFPDLCPVNTVRVLLSYTCGAISVRDFRIGCLGIAPLYTAEYAFVL